MGTRLGEITINTPKPLVCVGGRPFLEYILWNLGRHGIEEIIFSVGYIGDKIIEHFGDGRRFGVCIEYVVEQEPAGTGGALKLANDKLDKVFLVLNGDTLFDINYLDLALLQYRTASLGSIALRRVAASSSYGSVSLEGEHLTGFFEKAESGPGIISGGVYVLQRKTLDHLPSGPSSFEHDLFPVLAGSGQLTGKVYKGFFIDIGLPETLEQANSELSEWQRKPAVFFDRDGVLNIDYGYVHQPDKFHWIEGAQDAIKWFNDIGYLVVVLANQSGIGRGYYTEDHFLMFTKWVNDRLRSFGAHIDATYFCPHHPEAGKGDYKRVCGCRKPAPGLIDQALAEWNVDLKRSILIGDKEEDLRVAQARGIEGRLFQGGSLLDFVKTKIPLERNGVIH